MRTFLSCGLACGLWAGGAWAERPVVPLRLPVEAGPLQVGELPPGRPFRVWVAETPRLVPRQVRLWPAAKGRCAQAPRDALARAPSGPLSFEGAAGLAFDVPRLPLESAWCVAVEGVRSVAVAERAAALAALEGLLLRLSEQSPPLGRAERQAALAGMLRGLATARVVCQDPAVCPEAPTEGSFGGFLNAWIEGRGERSAFAEAVQLGEQRRGAQQSRAAHLERLRAPRPTPDAPAARKLAEAVGEPLAAATAQARLAGLWDAATPASEGGALRPGVAEALAALRAAADQGAAAWAAGECEASRPDCKALRQAIAAARRAAEALAQERAVDAQLAAVIAAFGAAFDAWAAEVPVTVAAEIATAQPSYTTRAGWYLSADVGLAVPFFAGTPSLVSYFGASFSFVPVDKDLPLAADDGFWKRASVIVGLTLNDVADPAGSVRPSLGATSVLAGAGFRLTDYLRLSAGGLLVRQVDPNPTVRAEPLRVTPFVGLSIDLDLVGLVKQQYAAAQGLGGDQ